MILYVGRNLAEIADLGLPAFIEEGVYRFGDKMPRQFRRGDCSWVPERC